MIKLGKILKEAEGKLSYTPEKVDEFLKLASKDLATGKRLVDSYAAEILDMSISSVVANPEEASKLLAKIKEIEKAIDKQHGRYYNVVDVYDVFEAPDNVKKLEKAVNELDEVHYSIGRVADALGELISASRIMKDFTADTSS